MVRLLRDPSCTLQRGEEGYGGLRPLVESPQRVSEIHSQAFLSALSTSLRDQSAEVRLQSVRLLNELVPVLDPSETDHCMRDVIAPLITCLGDPHPAVRDATALAVNTYARYTGDFQLLLTSVVDRGLRSGDPRHRQAVLGNCLFLLTKEHVWRDLHVLVHGLIMCLFDEQMKDVKQDVLHHIELARDVIGDLKFSKYVELLPQPLHDCYENYMNSTNQAEVGGARDKSNGGLSPDYSGWQHASYEDVGVVSRGRTEGDKGARGCAREGGLDV